MRTCQVNTRCHYKQLTIVTNKICTEYITNKYDMILTILLYHLIILELTSSYIVSYKCVS